MQSWRLLIAMMAVVSAGYGEAEVMPEVIGSTFDGVSYSGNQEYFQTEIKKTTNSQRTGNDNSASDAKTRKTYKTKNTDDGPFRSNSQTLQKHHHVYPINLAARLISSPSELLHQNKSSFISNHQFSKGSLKPARRPILLQGKFSSISGCKQSVTDLDVKSLDSRENFQNKSDQNNVMEKIFKRHLRSQIKESHHRLTPFKVVTTTPPYPSLNPMQSSTNGIMIKHRGHSSQNTHIHTTKPNVIFGSLSNNHNSSNTKISTHNDSKMFNLYTNKRHSSRHISPSMLQVLVPKRRINYQTKVIQNKLKGPFKADLKEKKIVKKSTPKVKANIVAISGIHNHIEESASPSIPVVIVTTQMPFIKSVMHTKLLESRTLKNPRYTYKDSEMFHNPLYSIYGPPYDHYKFSPHKSSGGSFPPTKFPHYQTDKKFLQEHFVLAKEPNPEAPTKKHDNLSSKTQQPFREQTIDLTPSPVLLVKTQVTKPSSITDYKASKKVTPKVISSKKVDDSYFQSPYHHSSATEKTTSASNSKGKSLSIRKPAQSTSHVERYSAISEGIPGVDYPIYSVVPYTSFSCKDKKLPGIYGDAEAECQVWHMCEVNGRLHSFLCPNGTIFNQELLTCDWWYNVHCDLKYDQHLKKSEDAHKSHNNDIPEYRRPKTGKSLSLSNSHQKPDSSTYSSLFTTKEPTTVQHLHTHHSSHFTPSPPHKKPIFTARGIQGLHTLAPVMKPTFLEFQPYHEDTYPMFKLRKRHAKTI